ncbi:MAG: hypothetical protein Q4F99_01240 [bacterium]|nr:hypothetical protein [bacterium]
MKKILFFFVCVMSMFAFGQSMDRGARGERIPWMNNEELRWLDAALYDSGFMFNDRVRTAYYDYCMQLVAEDLKFNEETWEWLNDHPAVFNATFALEFPPNPNVIHNFVKLAKLVGPYYAEKYQQLLIAFAVKYRHEKILDGAMVTDRYGSITSRNLTWDPARKAQLEQEVNARHGWAVNHDIDFDEKNYAYAPSGKLFPDQQILRDWDARLDGKFKLTDANALKVVDWLKANPKTQIYEIMSLDQGRFKNKTGLDMNPKSLPWDTIAHVAHRYPPRMEGPIVANLCLRIQRYEERGAEKSELFPLSRAPWPLLLLLTQQDPIDESTYWWNYYKGKGNVPGYATYSFDYTKPEIRYHDGVWHPDATPRILVDGGVCGRLSTMAEFAQRSIGTPAQGMGQPGHRAFMTYTFKNGKYQTELHHSVNTIDVSTVGWHLPPIYGPTTDPETKETTFRKMLPNNSDASMRDNVRWHIGLCEAMNIGLVNWENSRMALHILDMYDEVGVSNNQAEAMLRSAMLQNIANTDAVFRLAKVRKSGKNSARRIEDLMQGFANMFVAVEEGCTNDKPLALNTNFGDTQAGADLSALLRSNFAQTIRNTKKVKNEWALFVRQAIFLGAFTNIPDITDEQYLPKNRGRAGWNEDKNAYAKVVENELKYQKKLANSPFLAEVTRLNDKYEKVRLQKVNEGRVNIKEQRARREAEEGAW